MAVKRDELCVARGTGSAGGFLDDSAAPEAAQSGDAPCYVTSDATGGGAVFDFSGDGRPDIIYTLPLLGSPVFLENTGGWSFDDVSEEVIAGMNLTNANGVAVGDVDNDGLADVFFTSYGADSAKLLINEGEGHFVEEGDRRGVAMNDGTPHFGTGAVFGDFDNDGWLDLHTTEYLVGELADRDTPGHARLFRNMGAQGRPGVFEDVTEEAGVRVRRADGPVLAFVSAFYDINDDGWLDLHVVSDFNASRLFVNNGDGTFRDGSEEFPVVRDESGMGLALGDFSGDGTLDIFVAAASQYPTPTPMSPTCAEIDPLQDRYLRDGSGGNWLYLRDENRLDEATDRFGVRHSNWSWGATSTDFTNDGKLDLITVSGFSRSFSILKLYCMYPDQEHYLTRIWQNTGSAMVDIAPAAGVDTGTRAKSPLAADLDGDGDEDLVVFRSGNVPALYENTSAPNGFVTVAFSGEEHPHNARVTVFFNDGSAPTVRYAGTRNGLYSSRYVPEVIGLGARSGSLSRIEVRYQSGRIVTVDSPVASAVVVVP